MINGDHATPAPHCPTCHGRGWIDELGSAIRYLRRCDACEGRRPLGTVSSR